MGSGGLAKFSFPAVYLCVCVCREKGGKKSWQRLKKATLSKSRCEERAEKKEERRRDYMRGSCGALSLPWAEEEGR